ncbi:MAG: hypothetical protein M9929_05835 [Burkholderiaceae bacterium]|nr:hypothetical protein [Burkholderiaceae bacterium]
MLARREPRAPSATTPTTAAHTRVHEWDHARGSSSGIQAAVLLYGAPGSAAASAFVRAAMQGAGAGVALVGRSYLGRHPAEAHVAVAWGGDGSLACGGYGVGLDLMSMESTDDGHGQGGGRWGSRRRRGSCAGSAGAQ